MRSQVRKALGVLVVTAALLAKPGAGSGAEQAAGSPPEVRTLGEGEQRLSLVDHGDSWSLHFENAATTDAFRLWHEGGGPEMISKTPIDRTYTMSVHRLAAERIVERLLDGYGYTLHYDAGGRLAMVRVYSPQPAQLFKAPRLAENLGKWREVEAPAQPVSRGEAEPDSPPGEAPADTPAAEPSVPPGEESGE